MGTICFVILNYKTWREAAACAESILKTQQGQDIRIVLVDNGSGNGSEESLREEFAGEKRVHVIASEKNLGFARGNNLGIRVWLGTGSVVADHRWIILWCCAGFWRTVCICQE